MNTIILATGFSEEAENATNYAETLADQVKAKLLLFNSAIFPIILAIPLFSLPLLTVCPYFREKLAV